MNILKSLTTTLVATASILVTGLASAEKISMEGGPSVSVTAMLPQSMAPAWSEAGIDVELALGQTLTKSLLKLSQDKLDSAVMPPTAYRALKNGVGPYAKLGAEKGAPLAANVRTLFGFTASTWHPMVWADSGIESWQDIKGKKVYIGPPAGAANAQARAMIKHATGGFEDGKDYEGVKAPWNAAIQGYKDGQWDVHIQPFPLGSQNMVEIGLTREFKLLGLPESDESLPRAFGMRLSGIPAGTYPGQVNGNEDLIEWETVMMMAVNKSMSDDTAYLLTKTYFDNLAKIKSANAAFSAVNESQRFASTFAPLHPGAVRYYQENNIDIPEEMMP